jgi:hypothetical protein
MAILTSFPLSHNDQADVIEIFIRLMQQLDDAAHSAQAPTNRPISSPPDLPDLGVQRDSSGPQ